MDLGSFCYPFFLNANIIKRVRNFNQIRKPIYVDVVYLKINHFVIVSMLHEVLDGLNTEPAENAKVF